MSKKKINLIVVLMIILIAGFLGLKSLNPSKPNYTDDNRVNVTRQMKHIRNISKEPHSIFDVEAKEEVKKYLLKELKDLGVDTQTYKYKDIYEKRTDSKVDIENIYGEIKGKTDSYIMLVTHYDSSRAKKERYAERDGSLGSADAGYGLSTILETLRVIKESGVKLHNGIKVLITDGEEYGLLGAKEAVKEKDVFEGVNYIVNIEARGTKGPAVMFETSPNNSSVIDLYKSSHKPFSYSITPEIYRLLPNSTDFTVFLENDMTGINISVLDGLENYHTPNDNPDNLSDESMQHYGDQVLPIVKEFVSNEKYSNPDSLKSDNDSIFFILGNKFIEYSKIANMIVLIGVAILILFIAKKIEIKKPKSIVKYLGLNIGFTLISMIIGYGISRLVALINGREFKLTYLPLIKSEGLIFVLVMLLVFIAYFMTIMKTTNKLEEKNEFTLSSLILLYILSLVLTIVLPGASYLTVLPAVLLTISCSVKLMFIKDNKVSYIFMIPIFLVTLLYVPTIYLFNCALTLGALCANILFAMFAFISLIVAFVNIEDEI